MACLVADTLSHVTKKLARLRGADFSPYHDTFKASAPHIDTVINPDIEAVRTIERLMSVPGAADVGEFADGRIKFVGVYLETGSQLTGVRLADLPNVLKGDRPVIAAIFRDDRLIIPRGGNHLRDGDLIHLIGEEKNPFKRRSV